MVNAALHQEMTELLSALGPDQQRKVIDYARSLRQSPVRGTPGRELLRFFGTMSEKDADDLMRGIEEDCESVDPNEW